MWFLRSSRLRCSLVLIVILWLSVFATHAGEPATRHVLLVTTDGLRWQEVFRGADDSLMNHEQGGVPDAAALSKEFGGETPEERRVKLLPFLWGTLAKRGQIYGNRERGSLADVTNSRWFSYPGYNELLTGRADDARITSNQPLLNPNVSVLEWLQGRPGFAGKVTACTAWYAFPAILNTARSRLPVWTAASKDGLQPSTPRLEELKRLVADVPSPWPDEHYDAFVQRAALEVLATRQPRVLYVSFGETDEWAHARRYDQYLQATHRVDRWIEELWEAVQSSPEYRDHTVLVLTTDHGRGATPEDWTSHGEKVPQSGQIWMAALGPGVPALGERVEAAAVKQGQVAATVARFVGEDYATQVPGVAGTVGEMFAPATTTGVSEGTR